MYRCDNCGRIFEDDDVVLESMSYEDYYGVGRDFPDKHYFSLETCPYCGSEDVGEYDEEEEVDEDA